MGSESDNEFEGNQDDDEYQGLRWIGGEAFYEKKTEKRKLTREDNLYGVFAEDMTETNSPKTKRRQTDLEFTEPVSFVSLEKVAEVETVRKASGIEISYPKPKDPTPVVDHQKKVEIDESALPTSFGQKIRSGALRRQKEEEKKEGLRKAWKDVESSGFASFEKHSRGIASKLMEKMGYKPGEGLGVKKQGVVDPILQRMRPKSMGMGYGDFEEKELDAVPVPEIKRQPKGEEKTPSLQLWKQTSSKERKERRFKSLDDVAKQTEAAWRAPAVSTILDMRGPKARVLTDLGQTRQEVPDDDRPLPELRYNFDLLVELTEIEIKERNAKRKNTEDVAVLMEREEETLLEEYERRAEQLRRLEELQDVLDTQISQMDPSEDADALLECFERVKESYSEEFASNKIGFVAVAKMVTFFERLFQNWNPLEDPERGVSEMDPWKSLLSNDDESDSLPLEVYHFQSSIANALKEDPFALLMLHVVLPPLRSAIVNEWLPREPEALLTFLDHWKWFLPSKLLNYVSQFLVFPKLKASVEDWNPCKEAVALHVWIHPWLPFMNQKLIQLYPIIIYKLLEALKSWNPSDTSVRLLLTPWKTVFTSEQWETLLTKAILPKLARSIQDYEVDPARHSFGVLEELLEWLDVIPKTHIVQILDRFLFPKWLRILHYWLTHRPNLEEVSLWYKSWKSFFPSELLDDVDIASHFGKAIDLMNRTADGIPLPSLDVILGETSSKRRLPETVTVQPQTLFTLRDMVQRFAEEHNVSFMPKPGRMHEGLQVYSFGGVSVVLDNAQNTVRIQNGSVWKPASLERLLTEMHQRRTKS